MNINDPLRCVRLTHWLRTGNWSLISFIAALHCVPKKWYTRLDR